MLLAVDPGNTHSAYALLDKDNRPAAAAKVANEHLLEELVVAAEHGDFTHAAIEMVASYGMAVGKTVFDTCVWIGRFQQILLDRGIPVQLVYRMEVKMHHCHAANAKDTNIRQALVDRFAPGQPNHGKGTKADPGWFHGFSADIWAAYALGVYVVDSEVLA